MLKYSLYTIKINTAKNNFYNIQLIKMVSRKIHDNDQNW